jgi:uncharacterized membrane protein (UPF0127 family)
MARLRLITIFIVLHQIAAPVYAKTTAPTEPQVEQAQKLPLEPLTIITTQGQTLHFKVEIAANAEDQSKGLMHRQTLARDGGMLFLWPEERPVSMWMKNTYLSLDMLFINRRGEVVHIAPHTTPLSETIIDSQFPVSAVLELAAGTAADSGIAVGSRLLHPHFKAAP